MVTIAEDGNQGKLELRSAISHLHLPSNPKQMNCVVLCKKINKQTKQH
jgi:hypothetical protein